ncbi:glutathione S-transferase [Altererythrobacter atlanticus]|uniref:Beta-etherase n=1 Tax=Croceibacterium atlanticum TaxID=1267766 RepID=A0A0F7KSE2_9SPHN|nr:beta-etherase [Croceibacterium atlanticum]AKH42187.1 Beta-etherase [Croceibacterium atlanticum]MBB5734001.1 glutathione S-transferase [Croceibacterium atlanticum]
MAKNNTITFYDLALSTGATISPFVWATKYALKHKGFDLDVVPGGFTGIPERTGGKTERLPAIVDDGKWVLDSWGIVEYLDETYPDRPALIPHPSVAALTRAMDAWFWKVATGPWMRCFCANYRDLANKEDHEYITHSREIMLGKKLEDMQAGYEERLPGISADLEPLRIALREVEWLGGDGPNYADYRIMGSILFTASVCKTSPVLADDDPLRDWIERCLDLFGGLGRHPGLFPLFGLPHPENGQELFAPQGQGGIHKRNTGVDSTRAESEKITQGMSKD